MSKPGEGDMFPPGFKITTEILWTGALEFAIVDLFFVSLLAWQIKPDWLICLKWNLAVVSAIFWFVLWASMLAIFWETVYQYVFPAWAFHLIPIVDGIISAFITLLFWWIAGHVRRFNSAVFCLLGGIWGLLSHINAVLLGIVRKPPILQGASPYAAIGVAIFEFIFYWCIILSISALSNFAWNKLNRHPGKQVGG
jgi:hypothetical protein